MTTHAEYEAAEMLARMPWADAEHVRRLREIGAEGRGRRERMSTTIDGLKFTMKASELAEHLRRRSEWHRKKATDLKAKFGNLAILEKTQREINGDLRTALKMAFYAEHVVDGATYLLTHMDCEELELINTEITE